MATKAIQLETQKIPKLRFPGFSGWWEEKKLGEVFDIKAGGDIDAKNVSKNKNDIFKYPIFANSEKNDGLYGYSNIYKIDYECITVTGRGSLGTAVARFEKFYPIVRLLILKPKDKSDVRFFENYINQMNFFVESTGVPQLTGPQISIYKLKIPKFPEQRKIAGFLGATDEWIENLQAQKESFESYKKGIMQKIFLQEIRFKDDKGKELPKWEEKKLGEYMILNSIKNKNNKFDLVLSVSNKKGFIAQSEQFEDHRVASRDVSNYKIVEQGNFAYNPSRINVGSIACLKNFTVGIVSPMYVVFRLSKKINTEFFENYISTHYFKYLVRIWCSGSVRDSLNFEDLEKFKVKFPTLQEQQKIAEFLTSIDKLIESKQQQISQAEQWKKGLMQGLFV